MAETLIERRSGKRIWVEKWLWLKQESLPGEGPEPHYFLAPRSPLRIFSVDKLRSIECPSSLLLFKVFLSFSKALRPPSDERQATWKGDRRIERQMVMGKMARVSWAQFQLLEINTLVSCRYWGTDEWRGRTGHYEAAHRGRVKKAVEIQAIMESNACTGFGHGP